MRTTRSSKRNTRSCKVEGDDDANDYAKDRGHIGSKRPEQQESSEAAKKISHESEAESLIERLRAGDDTSSVMQKDEANHNTSTSVLKDETHHVTEGPSKESPELDESNEPERNDTSKVGTEDKSHPVELADTSGSVEPAETSDHEAKSHPVEAEATSDQQVKSPHVEPGETSDQQAKSPPVEPGETSDQQAKSHPVEVEATSDQQAKSHPVEPAETSDQPSENENAHSPEGAKKNGGRAKIEVEVTSEDTQPVTPLKHDLQKNEASNSKNSPARSHIIEKSDKEVGGDAIRIQGDKTFSEECTLHEEEQCKEQEASKRQPSELTKCNEHVKVLVDSVLFLSNDDKEVETGVNPAEVTDVDNTSSHPEESSDSESSDKSGTEAVEDDNETWDLKSVFSFAAISKSRATKCYTDGCSLVAACQYVSNKTETWSTCLDCQEDDFGGWPESDELPLTSLSKDHEKILAKKCSAKISPRMPRFDASEGKKSPKKGNRSTAAIDNHEIAEGDEDTHNPSGGVTSSAAYDDSDVNAAEEKWDLTKILEPSDAEQIKCSTKDCSLAAAAIWISSKYPNEKWYTCIDCQEEDFGGWPEEVDGLPCRTITNEHRRSLSKYCSNKASPNLPALPLQDQGDCCPSDKQGKVTSVGANKKNSTDKEGHRSSKPSASALALHRKWQEAAVAMGGPDARIIVSKIEAKELVFELLHDAFQPMNITQLHKELKALVPSPILKSCLDDMCLESGQENRFDDSDGEGDGVCLSSRKKSTQPYVGSLIFKSGKNSSACLYFVDYSKLENGGNGLDSEERNLLVGKLAEIESEQRLLDKSVQSMTTEAKKLQSEPTNQELVSQLAQEEPQINELLEKVESARELKVNEKHKKQTKRRVDVMTSAWRKRKRLCTDFLLSMEEMTDGTISVKKCMKGDGQIYIESDETILRNAKEFGEKKRRLQRDGQLGKAKRKGRVSIGTTKRTKLQSPTWIPGDDNFIAVTLDARGVVKREYFSSRGEDVHE